MTASPSGTASPARRRGGTVAITTALLLGSAGLAAVGTASPASAVSADVVLSEVYGGGGTTGATFRNDFVELANRGSAVVDLTGWSVQYASATGTTWQATALTGSLGPGATYLVQQASSGAAGAVVPTPDVTGGVNLSAASGKVALVRTTTPLTGCTGSCVAAAGVHDFLGYGTANDFEGAPAPGAASSTAVYRFTGPDTDDNDADFGVAPPTPKGAPVPQPVPGTDCSAADTAVGSVQGSGETSPLAGRTVTVQGTVVGDYEGPSPALRGFYVQDGGDGDRATSDAVFVFNNLAGISPDTVSLGQVVQVTGTASEFQGQTQVSAAAIDVCGDGATVAPVDVTLPRTSATDLEPYEGMLVRLAQTLTVTEHFQLGRFGEVLVSANGRLRQPTSVFPGGSAEAADLQARNDLNQLLVDDGTNRQNPATIVFGRGGAPLSPSNTLRGGDTLTDPVGVITYTFGGEATASPNAYRLRPIGALGGTAVFEPANPRPSGTPAVGGNLRVASANLLNFFNTSNPSSSVPGCTFGTGGPPADCRGAENPLEYDRQLAKEVAAITSLDADVVAVMELENDGYGDGSAIAALVAALDAAQGAGTWAFADADAGTGVTNSAGTDAIKAALLYKPAAVTPVAGATFTDRAQTVSGVGVFERNPVAQTFLTSNGARVTVVANHFKSKGSCPAAGTDPANEDAGDGQGCWNARRTAQATELVRWLGADVVPAAGSPDVLVVGDLNSYSEEDPIEVLEAAGYVNLPRSFHGDETYSYVFDGQWGYLDYALASPSLAAGAAGADEVHINADEPSVLDYNTNFKSLAQVASLYAPDRFRTSDHDPVLAGLQLVGATTTTVTSSAPQVLHRGEVRWTATVGAQGSRVPAGTVRFTLGGRPFGEPVPLVDGRATSPATSALPPGATSVGAVYSGSADHAASTGTFRQEVRFVVTVTRPAAGSAATAGSTVKVRFTLTDAVGPVPVAVARAWVRDCRSTVSVSGAQTLTPRCVRTYEPDDEDFSFRWKSARSPQGAVTVTVAVTYPGIADPQTASVPLRLR
ncbi:MAG: ExeM/NucH family extracellular endonuclease [Kineosporiaceae bacterium]